MANDKIPQQGGDRPTLKYLTRYVMTPVGSKWKYLGIELTDNVEKLNLIAGNHPYDISMCCTKMFEYWLESQSGASWNQLIESLKRPQIELNYLADKITQQLQPAEPLDFSPDKPMLDSFVLLVDKFSEKFKKYNIPLKKAVRLCKGICKYFDVRFPSIQSISSMEDLFNVIHELPLNNCFNLHVLRILADGFDIACLRLSLQNYLRTYSLLSFYKAISSMPGMFQRFEIRMQRDKLTVDQLIDRLNVGCLIHENDDTAAIFDNNTCPPNNCVSKKQEADCLEIVYVRVNDKVEFCGSSKDMVLFQYYSFLMQDIEYPASLCNEMKEKGLLCIDQLNIILAAPMDYMRNIYIFDMSVHELFTFMDIIDGFNTKGIMKLTEGSTDNVVTENQNDVPPSNSDGIPQSTEELQHFKLFNKLAEFLDSKSVSVHAVIDILSTLKSFKFSSQLIKMFSKCSNMASLLKALLPYSTFYDTSIIKKLLEECCPEALKLLEEVNQGVDWNKCISSYHIPKPSPLMIPDKQSCFTLMATRHHQEIRSLQLKHIALLKSLLLEEFAVPEYACTLLAIGLTICYWLISKSTAKYICFKIKQHCDYFKCNQIVEEIAIYPEPVFSVTEVSAHGEKYLWDGHTEKERIPLEEFSTEFTDHKVEYVQETVSNKDGYMTLLHSAVKTNSIQQLSSSSVAMKETVSKATTAVEETMHHSESKTDHTQDSINRHFCKQYETILDENRKLKKDESDLLMSFQTLEQKCKKLEERSIKVQEDVEGRIKERITNQHRGLLAALGQVIKTIDKDAKLPIKDDSPVKAEEHISTIVEDWHQLEYETDDIQKLIVCLQHCADQVNKNMDVNKQQQNQWTEELEELNTKLSMKEMENTKLKDERKLLLKNRCESRETFEQLEIKVDKGPYPVQYELLGSGNYGQVYKVHYKGKIYVGKLLHSKLLPGHSNVKLLKKFRLKCTLVSKFSHPNVEQFVEITHANDKGVPIIITELLIENLTAYISRTSDTFHYNLQLSVCNDMAQGLQYLHSQHFVHLNFHGANVLMTSDHHAKIADYLCPLLHTGEALDSTSTAVYQSPESSQRINVQSNVFTLAVLFVQVITKHFPQLKQHHIDLQGIPSWHPLRVFIQQCLSSDVAARPLMGEICDYLAKLLEDKESTQMVIFKLIHTTEYAPLLPSLTNGRNQLSHRACQNLPVPMYWAYAVTIGMKVYVTGGNSRNGDALEHVFRFNLENNKWDKLLPPLEYHHCVPVVLEGILSMIGGFSPRNKAVVGNVKTYDEDESQWVTTYPDMNVPRYRPAVVTTDSHTVVMGGKIQRRHVITRRKKLTDSIEVMSINDKQWTTVATPLPTKMYDMSATISNNLVWIIGYDDGDTRFNKVFTVPLHDLIYLPSAKHPWKRLCNDAVYFKTATVHSDPPVILGGDDRQNRTISAVVVFDPKTESWNEVATLSSPRAYCAVAKLPGERGIIVIGGCSETKHLRKSNSSCLSTTEIYYFQ